MLKNTFAVQVVTGAMRTVKRIVLKVGDGRTYTMRTKKLPAVVPPLLLIGFVLMRTGLAYVTSTTATTGRDGWTMGVKKIDGIPHGPNGDYAMLFLHGQDAHMVLTAPQIMMLFNGFQGEDESARKTIRQDLDALTNSFVESITKVSGRFKALADRDDRLVTEVKKQLIEDNAFGDSIRNDLRKDIRKQLLSDQEFRRSIKEEIIDEIIAELKK